MANIKAIASGNWSQGLAVFSAVPQPGDSVYANGKNIVIDVDVNVALISNGSDATSGAVAGGQFSCSTSRAITANVTGGAALSCLILTGGVNQTIVGNLTGGTIASSYAVNYGGSGTLSVIGNIIGGRVASSNSMGLYLSGTGALTHVGNITATTGEAAFLGGSGSWTTTGTLQAAGNVSAMVCGNAASGSLTVNGNCIGSATGTGSGIQIFNGTFTVVVNGYAIAGESSNANFTHAGVYNASVTANVKVSASQCSSKGIHGTLGFVKYRNTVSPTIKVYRENGTSITLTDPADIANQVPAAADVRDGLNYLGGARTGSLKVPPAISVRIGVPVDNTVGTAYLDPEDFLDAIAASDNPVAERLRNCITDQTLGPILVASQS